MDPRAGTEDDAVFSEDSPSSHADSEDDRHQLVEQALAETDTMLSAFNALLRIARIESGARRAEFSYIDLTEVTDDVVGLYEPLADEKGQTLGTKLAPRVSTRGDRDLLFQALANVLDNAIKYTPYGGRIQVSLEGSPRDARIEIADSGPGIPADARDKVWRRFYRLDDSRGAGSSGLGLSLVQAVVQLHGGSVKLADNDPGLRVEIALPRD
jgi:signal transduction histidine kinase